MSEKYEAVMKEALVSAPRGLVIYDTVEVINVDASWTPRLVNQRKNKMMPLVEGEEPVEFTASGIVFTLPPTGENGTQDLKLSMQNVDRKMTSYMQEVLGSANKTQIIYRAYLSTDLSKPHVTFNLTLKAATVTTESVVAVARFADILNMPFPNEYYSRQRFPSLGN